MNIKCSPFISFYLSLPEKEGEKMRKDSIFVIHQLKNNKEKLLPANLTALGSF
jgi:hypothetical protein